MMIKKMFGSRPMNQILLINILIYIIGVIISFISKDIYGYYIFFLSLNSNISFDFMYPFVFITNGFVHSDMFHILGNMIIFIFYYNHFIKIESNKIWKIYLSAVLTCGIFWIQYLYFFEYTESILLGASGGIMALISYSCNKWGDDIAVDLPFIKVRFRHLLYMHMFLAIMNFLSHKNVGGEVAHLTGMFVGWYYSRANSKEIEEKEKSE